MRRLLLNTLAAGAGLALLGATATAAPAAAPPLGLPEPTGPLPIGQTQLHLVDHDRADPWVPEQRRELMTTLWYPTAHPDGPPAQYVTPAESRAILTHLEDVPDVPDDILSTTRTHAHTTAPPISPTLPLVVLSPGFSHPRAALTGLAEDLTSRGYAVALLSHNHESHATEFPDGRLTTCIACQANDPAKVVRGRADDIAFLLDELPRTTPLHPDRIAVVGHSIGGASAAQALHTDPRVRAGINLDGTFFPALSHDLDRPFMLIGTPEHRPHGIDESWDASWPHLTEMAALAHRHRHQPLLVHRLLHPLRAIRRRASRRAARRLPHRRDHPRLRRSVPRPPPARNPATTAARPRGELPRGHLRKPRRRLTTTRADKRSSGTTGTPASPPGARMSTIAIIGGTGFTGGNIARHAAARGHLSVAY